MLRLIAARVWTGNLPGPNAVTFIEHVLAALTAQTEITRRRAGQDTAGCRARWPATLLR